MMKIYLTLFCAILFNVALADTEPDNDNHLTADIIAQNGTESGNITAGNYDFFRLITTGDGDVTVTCTTNASSYLYATLYDSNGTSILGSVTVSMASGALSFSVYQLAQGTYYITIQGNGSDTYTISNSVNLNTSPNDAEPNNSYLTALPILVDDTLNGHISYRYNGGTYDIKDYYKFTTVEDGDISVSMALNNGSGINLSLLDSDGVTYVSSTSGVGGASLTSTALTAGTYYLLLSNNFSYDYSGYSISFHLTPTPYLGDVEPNNSMATAIPFLINSSTTGHLMHRNNGGSYDLIDYYEIITPTSGNINVAISNSNNNYISIQLTDNVGTNIIYQGGNGQSGVNLNATNLIASTYYLKVTANLTTEYSGYILNNTFVSTVGIDNLESNRNLSLYPNPVSERLVVNFNNGSNGEVQMRITDQTGRICEESKLNAAFGENTFTLNVNNLAKGFYFLTLEDAEQVSKLRFVKM